MERKALISAVKVRLLPPTPAEKVLGKIIELLPRRFVHARVVPECDVAVISEEKGEYKAMSAKPRLALDLSPAPRAGWYFLEVALVRNNGNREAFIEVVADEGSRAIPIPSNLRGTVSEVVYLPPGVTRLYWIPTGDEGFFSQSPMLIYEIGAIESFLRRAYRVVADLWRFRNMSPASRAGLTSAGWIRDLQAAYLQTARLRIRRLVGRDYASFIELHDTPKPSDIRYMRRQVTKWPRRPLISLIMPVGDAVPSLLHAAIESVAAQIYPHWELLLLADPSAREEAGALLRRFADRDSRIRLIGVENAAGSDIAAMLNAGLAASTGAFAARFNPHDVVAPHALYCVAQAHNRHPTAEFIYSDDDEIDERDVRANPRFKPDWNPDLLASCHYLGGISVFSLAGLREAGGYRTGFAGAENYELALRYTKGLAARDICHIPGVLYHVRAPFAKDPHADARVQAAHAAGKRALQANLDEAGAAVEDGAGPGLYRVHYPLPERPPLATIIIPTRDRVDMLRPCVESILQKTDYRNWEMLVVDNQSAEPRTLEYLAEIGRDARIRVLKFEQPFNYSAINNFAVGHAQGDVLVLLNNDVEVISSDWLTELVSHAIRPGVGAVGAKLLYAGGRVQHAGVIIGLGGVAGHGHRFLRDEEHGYCHRAVVVQNLSAVTGACLAVTKSAYLAVRGLNEIDLKVAFNDVDFCLRLREAGYRNIYTPYARLFHHESVSRGRDDTPEKHAQLLQEIGYMKRAWGDRLGSDPAYNRNLTLEFENFSLSNKCPGFLDALTIRELV